MLPLVTMNGWVGNMHLNLVQDKNIVIFVFQKSSVRFKSLFAFHEQGRIANQNN